MKRFANLLLSICLMVSLSTVAWAADTATGAVLRLETMEGTVSIANTAGRSLTSKENMRLLNGYTLSTSASSYAYISLDDTKAVKLDALTTCTIRKQGSKLELLVESGNIFFNVTAPLSSSETMNIRTSTMVTGIRGTSGTVWSDGANQSRTRLHTGSAKVVTINPDAVGTEGVEGEVGTESQVVKSVVVTAGQEAVSTRDTSAGVTDLTLISTGTEDYSGFELEAISQEKGLLEKILEEDDSALTQEVVAQASDRLAREQIVQETQVETAKEAQEAQTATDSVTQAIKPETSGLSGGSAPITTATVTTYDELTAALADSKIVTITLSEPLALEGPLTIPEGVTFTVAETGSLDLGEHTLTLNGTLEHQGPVTATNEAFLILPEGHDFIATLDETTDTYTLVDCYDYDREITETEDWADLEQALATYGSVTVASDITVTGSANLTSGTIDLGANKMILTSDASLTVDGTTITTTGDTAIDATVGTFVYTSGTVTAETPEVVAIPAGHSITTEGNTLTAYYTYDDEITETEDWADLEQALATYGSVTVASDITVTGSANLTSGTIDLGANKIILASDASLTVDGTTITTTGDTAIDATVGTLVYTSGTVTAGTPEVVAIPQDHQIVVDESNTLTAYYTYNNEIVAGEDWSHLETALATYGAVTVSTDLTMTGTYTVPSEQSIDLGDSVLTIEGTFDVAEGATITANQANFLVVPDGHSYAKSGDDANGYTLTAYYDFDNKITGDEDWADVVKALDNNQIVTILNTITCENSFVLEMGNNLRVGEGGELTLNYDSNFNISEGAFVIDAGGKLTVLRAFVNGDIPNYGTLDISNRETMTGAITNKESGTLLMSSGTLEGTVDNQGNFTMSGGTIISEAVTPAIENTGTMTFEGEFGDSFGEILVKSTSDKVIDDAKATEFKYAISDKGNDGYYHVIGKTDPTPETWAELVTALKYYTNVTVTGDLTMTEDYAVSDDVIMDLGENTITTGANTLTVNGKIFATGTAIDLSEGDLVFVENSITSSSADIIVVPDGHDFDTTGNEVEGFVLANYYKNDDEITAEETWDDVATAFERYTTVTIATEMEVLPADYEIPSGKTLVVDTEAVVDTGIHTITIGEGNTLTVNGTITGTGTVLDVTTGTLDYTYAADGPAISSTSPNLITQLEGHGFTTTGEGLYTLTGIYDYDATISGSETWSDVETALGTYDDVVISETTESLSMGADSEIPSGKTLTIEDGVTVNIGDYRLAVSGTLEHRGTITTESTSGRVSIEPDATMTNTGTVICTSINASYIMINDGTFNMDSGSIGALSNTYIANINGGTITNVNSYIYAISNDGTLNIDYDKLGTETGEILIRAQKSSQLIEDATTTYTTAEYTDSTDTIYYYATGTIDAVIDGANENWDDVVEAMDYFGEVIIDIDITVSDLEGEYWLLNNTITVREGSLTVGADNTFIANSEIKGDITVANGGTLKASGLTSVIDGDITNNGILRVTNSYADITGNIINNGDFTLNGGSINGTLTNSEGATFTMEYGVITATSGYAIENSGTLHFGENGTFGYDPEETHIVVRATDQANVINDGAYTTEYDETSGYYYINGTVDAIINGEETWADVTNALSIHGTVTISKAMEELTDGYIIQKNGLTIDSDGSTTANTPITVASEAALTLAGGTIGGDVTTSDYSDFTMTAGTIGGAFINRVEFTLPLGCTIKGDVTDNNKFILDGGTIEGAVLAQGLGFTMNNGTIKGDVTNANTFTLNEGTIEGNVSHSGFDFKANGGTIEGTVTNEASSPSGSFTLDGARLSGSVTNSGTFNMKSGEIISNPVTNQAGATFTMTDGYLDFVENSGDFIMNGGFIDGNYDTPFTNLATGTLTMSKGAIGHYAGGPYALDNSAGGTLDFTGEFSSDCTTGIFIYSGDNGGEILNDSSCEITTDYYSVEEKYYLTSYTPIYYVTNQSELVETLGSGRVATAKNDFEITTDLDLSADSSANEIAMGDYTLKIKAKLIVGESDAITVGDSDEITIYDGGTLQICGAAVTSEIQVRDGGTLDFDAGEITGDVSVANFSTPGAIQMGSADEEAILTGGVTNNGTMTLSDGATIHGDVMNTAFGTFNMSGGMITSGSEEVPPTCTFENDGEFTMSAGTIENTATSGTYYAIKNTSSNPLVFDSGSTFSPVSGGANYIAITSLAGEGNVIQDDLGTDFIAALDPLVAPDVYFLESYTPSV